MGSGFKNFKYLFVTKDGLKKDGLKKDGLKVLKIYEKDISIS